MSRKPASKSTGQVVVLDHDSKILAGNALGDPHVRKVAVWLPPGYDQGVTRGRSTGRGKRFPVLFDLVGFTGSGLAHLNWRPFDENVPERIARLIAQKRMGPTIVVFPDCFTSLGGNQYVNSSAIGRYADYLTRELIPFVDGQFRPAGQRCGLIVQEDDLARFGERQIRRQRFIVKLEGVQDLAIVRVGGIEPCALHRQSAAPSQAEQAGALLFGPRLSMPSAGLEGTPARRRLLR